MPAPHSAFLSLPDLLKLAFSSMDGSVRRAGGGRRVWEGWRTLEQPSGQTSSDFQSLSYNLDATTMPSRKHLTSILPKAPATVPPAHPPSSASSHPPHTLVATLLCSMAGPLAQPQAPKNSINHSSLFPVRTGSLRLFTDP